VAGTCEYGKETSGTIKCGEFLDSVQRLDSFYIRTVLCGVSKCGCFLVDGSGSSVGIGTGYWLEVSGIESRWGREFSHTSRPELGPIQPTVQRYRFFPRVNAAGS
jgi:hypothetical protein